MKPLFLTLEAFGLEHKEQIIRVLDQNGYRPKVVQTNL